MAGEVSVIRHTRIVLHASDALGAIFQEAENRN